MKRREDLVSLPSSVEMKKFDLNTEDKQLSFWTLSLGRVDLEAISSGSISLSSILIKLGVASPSYSSSLAFYDFGARAEAYLYDVEDYDDFSFGHIVGGEISHLKGKEVSLNLFLGGKLGLKLSDRFYLDLEFSVSPFDSSTLSKVKFKTGRHSIFFSSGGMDVIGSEAKMTSVGLESVYSF